MEIEGLNIGLSENVYEPAEDTLMCIELISEYLDSAGRELRVLDIGTGTGTLGLFAAKNKKVAEVCFTDINGEALRLAEQNYERNKKDIDAECRFLQCDMFQKIEGRFDLIIFNVPYLRHDSEEEENELSKAWDGEDSGVEISLRLMAESKHFLNGNGALILTASSLSDIERLEKAIKESEFMMKRHRKKHIFFEDIFAYLLEAE
jgi:release factor glutamine methyltransferase